MEDKRKIELVCYYCSKEIVLPYKEEEEKLVSSGILDEGDRISWDNLIIAYRDDS